MRAVPRRKGEGEGSGAPCCAVLWEKKKRRRRRRKELINLGPKERRCLRMEEEEEGSCCGGEGRTREGVFGCGGGCRLFLGLGNKGVDGGLTSLFVESRGELWRGILHQGADDEGREMRCCNAQSCLFLPPNLRGNEIS